MVLKKEKTIGINVPQIQKESRYDMIKREGVERRKKEKDNAIQNNKDIILEENRMEKIIVPYLDKLQQQLVEKNLLYFWIFPDESGNIKHKNINGVIEMQKLINTDIDKYKNTNIISVSISFYHNDDSTDVYRKLGIYLRVSIVVFPINNKGIISTDYDTWGADIIWKSIDFKLSKFSFKLIESITKAVTERNSFPGIIGTPFINVINNLQKKGYNFNKVLVSLPGLCNIKKID